MSETNHIESFKCPSCGAPVEYKGGGEKTVVCPFCGEPAPVPENLLSSNVGQSGQMSGAVFEMPQGGSRNTAVEMALIMKQIKQGNKIEAIKLYRQMFPVGLREAKDQVEAIERSMGGAGMGQPVIMSFNNMAQQPMAIPVSAGIPTRKSNAGCIVGILIIVVTLAILGVVFFSINTQISAIPTVDVAGLQKSAKATILAQIPAIPTKSPTRAPSPTPPYAVQDLTVGKEGAGAGQFTNANRIDVDGKGNIYVGEYDGGRVQVFDKNGKFLSQFNSGSAQSKLEGMAVDYKGTVYTSDGTLITRFNGQTGEKLGQLAYSGGPGFGELAVSPDGGLGALWYPTQANGLRGKGENFVLFNATGKVTMVISAPVSSRTGELEHTNAIAFDNDGNLYIASNVSNAVFKFGPDGKFVNRFGSPGNAPDQLSLAYSIAIDSRNQVYIKDAQGIIVYSADGRFLRRFNIDQARGLVFDSSDDLWTIQSTTLSKYSLGQ